MTTVNHRREIAHALKKNLLVVLKSVNFLHTVDKSAQCFSLNPAHEINEDDLEKGKTQPDKQNSDKKEIICIHWFTWHVMMVRKWKSYKVTSKPLAAEMKFWQNFAALSRTMVQCNCTSYKVWIQIFKWSDYWNFLSQISVTRDVSNSRLGNWIYFFVELFQYLARDSSRSNDPFVLRVMWSSLILVSNKADFRI